MPSVASTLCFSHLKLGPGTGHWVSASPADCVRFTATVTPLHPAPHAGNWSVPAVAGVALGTFPGDPAALGRFPSAGCRFGFKVVYLRGKRSLDWETEPAGGRSRPPPRLVPAGSPRPAPLPGALPVPLTPRHRR